MMSKTVTAALIGVVLVSQAGAAEGRSSKEFSLTLRTRVRSGPKGVTVRQTQATWDARKTAIIICDMWDKHWCKGATARVAEMAPAMNRTVAEARKRGALIIHAPSSCMGAYADHPARRRAQNAPKAPNAPAHLKKWATKLTSESGATWPIDQSDGGCDCRPRCKSGRPWRRQIGTIDIRDEDAITDSGIETWNLLTDRGIDNVIVMGVHTNMCVIGRPFGLRNLVRAGKTVVLMRDLTDAMYNSRRLPLVSHFAGTDLVVTYIETYVCPTVTSAAITGKPAFAFKGASAEAHIVFMIGEREYKTKDTLPPFAKANLTGKGFRCTVVHAAADGGDGRNRFPGLDVLKEADLLFVSVRRRAPSAEHMALIRAHLNAGKPLVGIRTSSHAFDTKGKVPTGHADWRKFDPDVLGGNYHGHYGHGAKTTVTAAKGAKGHPILAGVSLPFSGGGSLYKSGPLAKTARCLLMGTIPNKPPEPVAWTHTYKTARVFYTSLGHVNDFKDPNFVRMLTNAVRWALGKAAPKQRGPLSTTPRGGTRGLWAPRAGRRVERGQKPAGPIPRGAVREGHASSVTRVPR